MTTIPHHAWYPVATSDEVGRTLLARRLLDQPVALYRTTTGEAVALEDRCAHRPVRLSDGRLEGDTVVAAYTGFAYAPDGRCLSVPTQDSVPYGAAVRAYPVHDDGTFVWVWAGPAALARLRSTPDASLLRAEGWTTFGGVLETRAGIGLLLDNFCDITHVTQLDPVLAPPALASGPTPPLEVEVSETAMRFRRSYPTAPLAAWHAQVLGLPEDAVHAQVEEGEFVAPGLWVDRWTVAVEGHGELDGEHTFVWTHALTPVGERETRHVWRVSRNFSSSSAADGTLAPLFAAYYEQVGRVLEQMQAILDAEGERPEVAVAADAAVSHVRRVLQRLVAEEAVSSR